MMSLLDDPTAFSSRETERLFGAKFLDTLLKETEESDKQARLGRSGGPFITRSWNGRSQRGGGGSRYGPYQHQGQRGQNNNSRQHGGKPFYRYEFIFSIDSALSDESNEVGARLCNFTAEWLSITIDPWVLAVVSFGYSIDFMETPFQDSLPLDCVMGSDMTEVCDQEVKELLLKKAIISIPEPTEGFVSNMFAVKKKSNEG